MSKVTLGLTMVVFVANVACGSSEDGLGTGPGNGRGCMDAPGDGDARPDRGDCQATAASHPIEGATHMPICSPLSYGTNPPSSGNHYSVWAAYKTYDRPFSRGFWVHSLEHGAVVITYNCPEGCADEVAAVQAFIDCLPADCGDSVRRMILTPDPDLDVRFAASAWGHTLRANCFDRDAFSKFFTEHYDHAPESICGGGADPREMCGPSMWP
jgi:hypothetical protein